jgi:hypothetical protein
MLFVFFLESLSLLGIHLHGFEFINDTVDALDDRSVQVELGLFVDITTLVVVHLMLKLFFNDIPICFR